MSLSPTAETTCTTTTTTTCTTSPEQIDDMKLEVYLEAMCNKHVHSTMTRPSRFHCLRSAINKPTTDELWISPVYRRLAVAKFSKSTMQKLLTWPWPRPLREHSLITRLRLHMADPCTKSEVSSLSLIHIWRCRRLLTCRSRWSPYH